MKDLDDRTLLDELLGEADYEESDALGDPGRPYNTKDPEDPGGHDGPSEPSESYDRAFAARETPLPRTSAPAPDRPETAQRARAWPRPAVQRPAEAPGCRETGLTIAGFVIFVSVDSVMMYTPFRMAGAISLLPQALTLLLLAFGLGGLMVWNIRGTWRPVGVGLMVGWVFMTLISAGFFTGLNP